MAKKHEDDMQESFKDAMGQGAEMPFGGRKGRKGKRSKTRRGRKAKGRY